MQGNDDEKKVELFLELMDELNQIPVGDLVWLEDFRSRAIEKIRSSFGDESGFIQEVNEVVDDIRRPFQDMPPDTPYLS